MRPIRADEAAARLVPLRRRLRRGPIDQGRKPHAATSTMKTAGTRGEHMPKSITQARLVAAGACAVLLLAAVGGAAAKVEGDTIVLGAAVSLTGKYSVNGKNTK